MCDPIRKKYIVAEENVSPCHYFVAPSKWMDPKKGIIHYPQSGENVNALIKELADPDIIIWPYPIFQIYYQTGNISFIISILISITGLPDYIHEMSVYFFSPP